MLYGTCSGAFGRDHFDAVRIEAEGVDWIVVRYERGGVTFTAFRDEEHKQSEIAEWSVKSLEWLEHEERTR